MIAIPFIFFSILLVHSLKKNGFFNIGSYILILYTIISLMSIILDAGDFYTHSCVKLPIDILPAGLFCILLYICIYPYINNKFPVICPFVSRRTEKILDIMTYVYFIIFCIILIVSLTRIQQVLMSNSLAEIRNEQYTGDTVSFYNHLSGLPRYICALCSVLAPSGTIMTLIFMYNIAFRKKSFLFNLMTLCGSLSQLLIAINIADRSNFAYWILQMGAGFIIFFPYFSKKAKFGTVIFFGIILAGLVSYLTAVTISRFGMRQDGAVGGVINYLGQSYINFCNFIDYATPAYSLCEIFPFINHLLGGEGYFETASKVDTLNNVEVNVFPTFLGIIYSISGGLVMILYVLLYNRFSNWAIRHRPLMFELGDVIRIWAFSLVLILGLFGFYYSFMNCTIAFILWMIVSKLLNPPLNLRRIHYLKMTRKI